MGQEWGAYVVYGLKLAVKLDYQVTNFELDEITDENILEQAKKYARIQALCEEHNISIFEHENDDHEPVALVVGFCVEDKDNEGLESWQQNLEVQTLTFDQLSKTVKEFDELVDRVGNEVFDELKQLLEVDEPQFHIVAYYYQ